MSLKKGGINPKEIINRIDTPSSYTINKGSN
jgi:hypothetical protein